MDKLNVSGTLNIGERFLFDGNMYYKPMHHLTQHLAFGHPEEANLCDAISRLAETNGMGLQDVYTMMPFILRMLKSNSKWAK